MVFDPLVWHEWHDDRCLSRRSLIWIREHSEPGDLQPIRTAIAALQADDHDTGWWSLPFVNRPSNPRSTAS